MATEIKKINPRALWLFFIVYLVRLSIIPIFIVFYFVSFTTETLYGDIESAFFVSFMVNIAAWIFASFVIAKMAHGAYRYTLADDYFMKETGFLKRRSTTIPYEDIKHVDTEQSIPERILRLKKVYIATDGASHKKSEGYVLGLSEKDAENLRSELVRRAHAERSR